MSISVDPIANLSNFSKPSIHLLNLLDYTGVHHKSSCLDYYNQLFASKGCFEADFMLLYNDTTPSNRESLITSYRNLFYSITNATKDITSVHARVYLMSCGHTLESLFVNSYFRSPDIPIFHRCLSLIYLNALKSFDDDINDFDIYLGFFNYISDYFIDSVLSFLVALSVSKIEKPLLKPCSFSLNGYAKNSSIITDLRCALIKHKFIAVDTNRAHFKQVFSGSENKGKIVWIGDISDLSYFIKSLIAKKILVGPFQKHWKWVANCFILDPWQPIDKLSGKKKTIYNGVIIDRIVNNIK